MTCGPNRTCYHGCACHEARWQERLAASEARCHDLERQRTEADCRFVGRYAEMSGSHCPWGSPCQRCQLEASEARVRALEEGIRAAMDYSGNRWSEWGERAENVADMLDALLAPPPKAEKKGGECG